jgi:diacylglycerol O-acyltransferase / wax synthase
MRVAAADAAWFAVDKPSNPMVVTGILHLTGPLALTQLQQLVQSRMVARFPEFSRQPIRRALGGWHWKSVTPELVHHVRGVCSANLPELVSQLMSEPLSADRPPWILHLVTDSNGQASIVARVHHGLADGMALAQVLLGLTDRVTAAAMPPQLPGGGRMRRPGPLRLAGGTLALLGRLLLRLGEPASDLRGSPQVRKQTAWTPPIALPLVQAAAAQHGVTINDILLAATAGGLRQYLGRSAESLRVLVPVDLRGGAAPVTLGNRLGLVFVRLPLTAATRQARVRAIAQQTRGLKESTEAGATFAILTLVGAVPRILARLAVAILSHSASAVVTNVPGPRGRLRLAGVEVESVNFWVPQVGKIAVGISIFSYAGQVTLGVTCDATLDIQADQLAAAVATELRALAELEPGSAEAD